MTNSITPWDRTATTNAVERRVAERNAKASKADDGAGATRLAAPVGDDQLELSAAARMLASEPEFDRAKVDAIRRQVEQGLYPLDPRRIAESVLDFERMIRE